MHTLIGTVIVLLLAGSMTHAQPGRMGDPQSFERIMKYKKVRMIEMMELGEEQSVRFFARLNEHEIVKRDLMKEKMDALDKIERLIRNRSDEKEVEKVFGDVEALNTRIAEQDRRFFGGLSDILTVEQRARYLLFERHFEKELREAMREVQRRRRGDDMR